MKSKPVRMTISSFVLYLKIVKYIFWNGCKNLKKMQNLIKNKQQFIYFF